MLMQAQQLTLQDAINTALKNNFDIQIARNNAEISRINNTYGMAGGLPSVNINASDNNSIYDLNQKLSSGSEINKAGVTSNTLNAGLTAGITLFNGFKVVATKERLNYLQSQSEILLNQQIQNTMAAVMTTYFDIVRQQSYLKIIQNSLDVSAKKLEILKARQLVGMANDADLLQAQMDFSMAEQNLKSQQLIVEEQKINLQQLIGIKQFSSISINDSVIVNNTLQKDSIFNFLINNPQYLSADQQVKINQQLVKEIGAQRYPSLKMSTGYNYNYSNNSAGISLFTQNYGPMVGATLQIPIFNGNIYKTQQEVARYNVQNAELQKENLLLSIKADAEKTWQSYENTLLQLKAQEENFENATKLVELVVEKFKVSQATILDLKAAQTTYENTAYLLINLKFSAKISEIELKRLVYQLGR